MMHCTHVGERGDEDFCAVHLINEGVVIDGRFASFFFQGTDAVTSYLCRLSSNTTDTGFSSCKDTIHSFLKPKEFFITSRFSNYNGLFVV